MLETDIRKAILQFVRTFHVVRLRHIRHFFSDWGKANCEYVIKDLLYCKQLKVYTDDIVCMVNPDKLVAPLVAYNETLRCLDMMTSILSSGEVMFYDMADHPLNIRFLTVSGEMYDVSYVDNTNYGNKSWMFPMAWDKCVPKEAEDPNNHIAVVPSLEVAQKIRDLKFGQFVVIDHNGGVQGIYDNE